MECFKLNSTGICCLYQRVPFAAVLSHPDFRGISMITSGPSTVNLPDKGTADTEARLVAGPSVNRAAHAWQSASSFRTSPV
eukprot:353169-Chlamydomonas_euryale.AAC.8